MKRFILFLILACLAGFSCKKEFSRNVEVENQAELNLEIEGEEAGDLSQVDKNEHSMFTFGGVAGLYYGCISKFSINKKASIEISFGTGLTSHTKISDEEFRKLVLPGERIFGSLGSFSSFPGLDSGRVEIAMTDKNAKRWCSTRIIEKLTDIGIETSIKLEQPHSNFYIDDIAKIDLGEETGGYRIKGHFECYLYEVNTNAKKKIKGSFVGIVSATAG